MGIALGTPCEAIMYSLESDGFIPIEGTLKEPEKPPSPKKEEFSGPPEKGYRPATCPLTKNDSKSHADFANKDRSESKMHGIRKGDRSNQRSFLRCIQRPHSSVLPQTGTTIPRAVQSTTQPEATKATTSTVPIDVAAIRSFSDSQNLEGEAWPSESTDTTARSTCPPAAPIAPPLPGAAAGEAAPGASNAYAVPHWVELAWEERPEDFWDCVDHFFAHGVWPNFNQQPNSLMNLCERQQVDPEAPSEGLRGFAPIWVFLLKEDDERVFRAAVDFYFECGRFPEWSFMSPSFVAMCEGMGIGEFDFYQ